MATHPNKHLSYEEKNNLVQFLLKSCVKEGKPGRGKIGEAAILFGVHRKTVTNLWAAARKQIAEGKPVSIVSNRAGTFYKKNELDEDLLKSIDIKNRSTIRDLAVAMCVSKRTICRWIKEGNLKHHTNAIKPTLTDSNRIHRLEYCLSNLKFDRVSSRIYFSSMRNVIHIDEKWFYITTANQRYYKAPGEIEAYRSCKSKRFITKVMFLCAVGRPHYAHDGTLIWDGKVGIFPFTELIATKRNSKNRVKGTMETRNVQSITKDVTKQLIINEVIPRLKALWPEHASKQIWIQQDNAKPHIKDSDVDFRQVASSDGFNIQLLSQHANSPDTNINDLGFFRSIQSLQHKKKKTANVDGLVQNVQDAFNELSYVTLNKVFLSLMTCCNEIMKYKGCNSYKLQHIGKDSMIMDGALPGVLEVDAALVKETIECLMMTNTNEGKAFDFGGLMSDLGH